MYYFWKKKLIDYLKEYSIDLYLVKIKLSTLHVSIMTYGFITNVSFLSYPTDLPHFPAVSHLNEEQLCHSKFFAFENKI